MLSAALSRTKYHLNRHPRLQQLAAYFVVGGAAGLTHLVVVALAVEGAGVSALVANVIGFAVAFFVSYAGHSRLTFPSASEHGPASRFRFFLVASVSFIINQIAYAVLLQTFGEQLYLPLLAIVLLFVAAITFIASKRWAFAGRHF